MLDTIHLNIEERDVLECMRRWNSSGRFWLSPVPTRNLDNQIREVVSTVAQNVSEEGRRRNDVDFLVRTLSIACNIRL